MNLTRTETHIINNSKQLDQLTFCSKNLYNQALYRVRQMFINSSIDNEKGVYLNYYEMERQLKDIEEYKVLYAKTRQQILKLLDKNWSLFFKSIKDYIKHPEKYTGKPSLPKYLDKKGRFVLIYPGQDILPKNGYLTIPKTNIKIQTKILKKDLKEVRIIPLGDRNFKVEIVYQKEVIINENLNPSKAIGIDIGMNNLMAITSNQPDNGFSCLINGRPVKSINQFYNKEKSKLQSTLKLVNKMEWSKQLQRLTQKRKRKIDDYFHKASRQVIQFCLEFGIGKIVIGKNKFWKQDINLGKKTNQNFVQIPFAKLIQMIQYKAEEYGVVVELVEESYTSKIDHLAGESLEHHEIYLGKRVKRGLFQSSTGLAINSDINGALGILRKANVACKEFFDELVASRGCVLQPIKLNC